MSGWHKAAQRIAHQPRVVLISGLTIGHRMHQKHLKARAAQSCHVIC